MTRSGLIFLILSAATLAGQTAAPVEFEVASIKPSEGIGPRRVRAGVHVDGSQVNCVALSLSNLVEIAYRVKAYQVSGPDFMAAQRFDINAKLPAGAAEKDVPEMLQSLLADRFKLKLHRESKDLAVYALVRGKGDLKMQEAPPDPPAEADAKEKPGVVNVAASGEARGVNINYGNGSYFNFGDNKLEGHKLTADQTAATLSRFTERPVVNMTDLKGKYDFVLELTPEDYRAMLIRSAMNAGVSLPPEALQYVEGASVASLFSAVDKLGLKLDSRKAPVEVLVIDHAEKSPTEN
jgi:uncharacterized protein (TIGR03435 family)